ncbi:ABC transporter substrate-binding protein [Actinophytocola sp.]|uniref:ABC transporter substrate-binding protein n=1 Tax=Actinophytocola sp. TaxID=1872138 RepID=UPI002ED3E02D
MLSKRLLKVMAAPLALLLAACSAGSTATAGSTDTSLVVAFAVEPENLDFTKTAGAAIPQVLLNNVYEGLVTVDDDGKIEPALATKWTVSDDQKTYDFTLRDGVTFSNGDKFDADAVKFSIERVKSAEWTVALKSGMDVVEKVEVVSPTEVKVVLSKPSRDWLFRMTTRIGAMFSPNGVADLANTAIGTGPYEVAKWTRGDSIELKARDEYWGDKPAMKSVTFKYFDDPTAMNNALLTGSVNVIGSMQAPDSMSQFKNDSRFKVIEGITNGEVVLSFNNAAGPLQDIRIRKAIKYALDRKAIVDTAWNGYGTLIGSMVPPTDPWYEDLTGLYPHDPEKAKSLLAEAGTPNLELRLRLPNIPYAVAAGQVVKSQLADVGITATIDLLEFPARWLDVVFKQHDYDMSIIQHVEPRDIAQFGNATYYFGYNNPKVQQLLAEADQGTAEQQNTDMKAAARQIADDAAADWLFLFPYLAVTDANLSGVPKNAITESFDVTSITRS